MTIKHAHYTFSYVDPSSDDHPVIHQYVLDSPKDIQTYDAVATVFLDFLSQVHGYRITPEMLATALAPAAA